MPMTSVSVTIAASAQATGYMQADGFVSPATLGVPTGTDGQHSKGPARFPAGIATGTTMPNPSFTGYPSQIPQVLAAVGATQGGAGVITSGVVRVTVTASTEGVRLPTAVTGREVNAYVPGTIGALVYPPVGGRIGTIAVKGA